MTDTLREARELAREIREGLPGVTPGPWNLRRYWAGATDEGRLTYAHIARCSPDNIAKLLDALEYLSDAYSRGLQDGIAAERERCAGIARKWEESSWGDEVFAARSIAQAILTEGHPNAR